MGHHFDDEGQYKCSQSTSYDAFKTVKQMNQNLY